MSAGPFLGVGWSFPPQPDRASERPGDISLSSHEQDVREAIVIILSTEPGERVMRPDFGAGLRAMTFEPTGTTTMALIGHRVETALVQWEPRIDVLHVTATASTTVRGRVDIAVDYRIRATNTFYNLVYPFYLLEGGRP